MSVLVKCRYKESFTTFLRSFSNFIVWVKLMNMYGKSRKASEGTHWSQTLQSTALSRTHLALQKGRLDSEGEKFILWKSYKRVGSIPFMFSHLHLKSLSHKDAIQASVLDCGPFLKKSINVLPINGKSRPNQKWVTIQLVHTSIFILLPRILFPQ